MLTNPKIHNLQRYGYSNPGHIWRSNFERFISVADAHHIEIIPSLHAGSRCGPALGYDVNLAACYPVRDAIFEVKADRNGVWDDLSLFAETVLSHFPPLCQ